MTDYDVLVKKGASLLDVRVPGWEDKINPDTFDIGNPNYCVLGQVYGFYDKGVNALRISFSSAIGYGYDVSVGDISNRTDLNAAWHRYFNREKADEPVAYKPPNLSRLVIDDNEFDTVGKETRDGRVIREYYFAADLSGVRTKIEIDYTYTEKGYK